jgi:calcium-dependent protein kinase
MITKTSFIGQFIADINTQYEFMKELGSGTYGNVYKVKNKHTGDTFACKRMNKRKIKNKERFKVEIDLMKATDHPNIVRLYEIYEDTVYLYLIMEECVGGDFFDRLSSKSKTQSMYTEKEAAEIFKLIMSSINYCHSHGVCHRDIKPENILFSSIDDDKTVKLIDFGLSKIFNPHEAMASIVGTVFYMAPEVLKGSYNEKCDVWSAGVLLVLMLTGRPPFYGRNDAETMKRITKMEYSLDGPEWKNISDKAKELIKSIFVESDKRPSSQNILDSDWVSNNAPQSNDFILSLDLTHFEEYGKLNKLQKYVINFVSFRLKDEDTNELAEIFRSIDTNMDGVITIDELRQGINILKQRTNADIDHTDIDGLFNDIDLDKNGLINYNEFIASLINYKDILKKENVLEAFRNLDVDKTGKVDILEIKNVIKTTGMDDDNYIEKLFQKLDVNNDGELDFDEFLNGLEMGMWNNPK